MALTLRSNDIFFYIKLKNLKKGTAFEFKYIYNFPEIKTKLSKVVCFNFRNCMLICDYTNCNLIKENQKKLSNFLKNKKIYLLKCH